MGDYGERRAARIRTGPAVALTASKMGVRRGRWPARQTTARSAQQDIYHLYASYPRDSRYSHSSGLPALLLLISIALGLTLWGMLLRRARFKNRELAVAATVDDIKSMLHSEKHQSRKRRPFTTPVAEFHGGCDMLGTAAARQKNEAASLLLVREFKIR